MKKATVFFLALAMVFSLAAFSAPVSRAAESSDGVQPVYGGTLIVNVQSDYASLGYPAKYPSMTHSLVQISAPALETLLRYDETGKPAPFLAESFETDAEAMTITLHLREGVKFHDGSVLDAETVKWNLENHIRESSAGALKAESIECPDESTVVIKLKEWSSTATGTLCTGGGLMISKAAVEANGVEWAQENPVGTGAYRFVSHEKDVKVVYEKFDDYWQEGKPYLDGIQIVFNNDQTVRILKFRNKEYDVVVRAKTADCLALAEEGYTYQYSPAGTVPVTLLYASLDETSPLANAKVREAISHAVDVDAIIDSIYYGAQTRTNQYAYPGHWGYDDSIELPEYDPELAKALLKEAGYEKGFETTLTHSVKAESADLACAAIQAMLEEIGIKVTINAIAAADVDNQLGAEGWQGIFFSWGAAQPDSATAFQTYYLNEKKYVSLIKPDELMEAIRSALIAKTDEEKAQFVHEAQRIINDLDIGTPLFATRDGSVTQPDVHDTHFSMIMPATLWTPADAWIDAR